MINLNRLAVTQAVWTRRIPGEEDLPHERIIHVRVLSGIGQIRVQRIGLRVGGGFFKCGSLGIDSADWPTSVRVLAWRGGEWQADFEDQVIPLPLLEWKRSILRDSADTEPLWLRLRSIEPATAYVVELRRSKIDGGWVPYPLAKSAVVFDGDADYPIPSQAQAMTVADAHPDSDETLDTVNYKFDRFAVGFSRRRPAISSLKLNCIQNNRPPKNLLNEDCRAYRLRRSPGLNLVTLDGETLSSDHVRQMQCSARFSKSGVDYALTLPRRGLEIDLQYKVSPSGIRLRFRVAAKETIKFSDASICTLMLDALQAIPGVLATNRTSGLAGTLNFPLLLHFPGYGNVTVTSAAGSKVTARFDANRSQYISVLDLMPGIEWIDPYGFCLPAGEHAAEIEWAVDDGPIASLADLKRSEAGVQSDLILSGIAFRADTGTLSNNGISTHCAYALDGMAELCTFAGELAPGLNAVQFVDLSLRRIFEGGPAYGFGNHPFEPQRIEHEYIQSLPSVLACIAICASHFGESWVSRNRMHIETWLDRIDAADLDHDGLIESEHRLGISGQHQWSTNWWDVVSFGWKDALVNAELYAALRKLESAMSSVSGPIAFSEHCRHRASQIAENYLPTFWNRSTNRVAGWRCREDKLHDHAFLFVNGAAVHSKLLCGPEAQQVIKNLFEQLVSLKLPHFGWGIPGNLLPVPSSDYALPESQPFPTYENGGLSWSNSYHFLRALLEVGMTDEFDIITSDLLRSARVSNPFDGCNTGVDWRRWDGSPCGYEGLLCDQFRWVWLLSARRKPELLSQLSLHVGANVPSPV